MDFADSPTRTFQATVSHGHTVAADVLVAQLNAVRGKIELYFCVPPTMLPKWKNAQSYTAAGGAVLAPADLRKTLLESRVVQYVLTVAVN